MQQTDELVNPVDIDTTTEGFTLILFNDAHHEFEEVINQVMLAARCGYDKAEAITMEAHEKGRAAVISGSLANAFQHRAYWKKLGSELQLK